MDCTVHKLVADVAVLADRQVLLVRYQDTRNYDGQRGWFLPDDYLMFVEHPDGAAVQRDRASLRAHAVDGLVPQIRCAPKDTDELCAILRVCDASGAAVIPWGGGTAMHWGNPPSRADVVISLEQLNRLVEHDDANLTATVQA